MKNLMETLQGIGICAICLFAIIGVFASGQYFARKDDSKNQPPQLRFDHVVRRTDGDGFFLRDLSERMRGYCFFVVFTEGKDGKYATAQAITQWKCDAHPPAVKERGTR